MPIVDKQATRAVHSMCIIKSALSYGVGIKQNSSQKFVAFVERCGEVYAVVVHLFKALLFQKWACKMTNNKTIVVLNITCDVKSIIFCWSKICHFRKIIIKKKGKCSFQQLQLNVWNVFFWLPRVTHMSQS